MKAYEYYAIGDKIDDLEIVAMVMRQQDFFEEAGVVDDAIDALMELRDQRRETG